MRILIDLPEDAIRWLDVRAAEQGKSRAALVREAISTFRAETNTDWIRRGAGYWKNRGDIGDGVDYQRAMRRGRTVD